MAEHTEQHDDHGVRFEKTDVEPKAVARFGLVLIAFTAVVGVLLVYVFRGLADLEYRGDPPPAPMANVEPNREPPAPRLQTQPFADVEHLRAEEDWTLTHYGWIDQQAGTVQIPIDVAMDQVAGKLPVRGRK